MSDTSRQTSMTEEPFVEDDHAETHFGYGDGKGPVALSMVALAWIAFFIGAVAYMVLYYFPDLAEWRAW